MSKLKQLYTLLKEKWFLFIEKYMDIFCSLFLFICYFLDWFFIEPILQIQIICIVVGFYAAAGVHKRTEKNKWSCFNYMFALVRILLITTK